MNTAIIYIAQSYIHYIAICSSRQAGLSLSCPQEASWWGLYIYHTILCGVEVEKVYVLGELEVYRPTTRIPALLEVRYNI